MNRKAIYLDGYLPQSKSLVRMERMARNTAQLKQFFSSNPRGCPHQFFLKDDGKALDLFNLTRPETRVLVTPTFLVPAVTDALRQHPLYQSLVHLVPAEADTHCAQHLAKHGGIVLTSDSDLLVHNLGNGVVAFFRDVHIGADARLVSATFIPSQICVRLGLTAIDICRLAYERKCSPHSSLPQIVQACLGPVTDGIGYDEFVAQYLFEEIAALPKPFHGNELYLEQLDPRLSELMLQLGQWHSNKDQDGAELRMFLPVLLESPARGSAWEPSTSVRILAYTVGRWAIPGSHSVVFEYRRVQNLDQKGRQLELLPKASRESFIGHLVNLLRQLHSHIKGNQGSFWLLVYFILDIRDRQDLEKESFVLRMLQPSMSSIAAKRRQVSWDHVHLLAHIQAMWYSLRMLSQVLLMVPDQAISHLSVETQKLRDILSELPPTGQCPNYDDMAAWLRAADQLKTMEIMAKFVAILNTPTNKSGRQVNKKKIGASKSVSGSSTTPKSSSAGNKFSLLATD